MKAIRKWTILLHRYLGIVLGLFVLVWFLSGIAMIYAGGMPELTPELRLERMPPIDFARVHLTPTDALARAGLTRPGQIILFTILDRPAYRIGTREPTTVFADNGEVLEEAGPEQVVAIASRFSGASTDRIHKVGVLTSADQWTLLLRGLLPLHKLAVDDAERTELYVSPWRGEVVLQTTRSSRMLAWAAAIPHWLYLTPLRVHDLAWRRVVLWTSGAGIVLTLAGLVLGVIQFSPAKPFRLGKVGSYNPYAGWMRWHYVLGLVFGIFTLTWVFSGLLSMEPWFWVAREGVGAGLEEALSGGPLDAATYPVEETGRLNAALPSHQIKEVELLRIQGEPYYLVRDSRSSVLLRADTLEVQTAPFSIDSIMARIAESNPGAGVREFSLLPQYDSYYYARNRRPPLPALRIKFDDPAGTWLYVDQGTSRLVASFTRQERLERWLYHGLHSLDFSFWYYNRPLWDAGVIALCLGGAASSGIGLYLGLKRVLKGSRNLASRN